MDIFSKFPGAKNALIEVLNTPRFAEALGNFPRDVYLRELIDDAYLNENGQIQITHHAFSGEPNYDLLIWNGSEWIQE